MKRRFDRDVYFDEVRANLFGGRLDQEQVDGQNAILRVWERFLGHHDLRKLSYALATTFHETAQTMQPVEEGGKGAGMSYGVPDPITGQTYYGRGFVQLTWAENYARADAELELSGDDSCYYHAANALNPVIAARIMFQGMEQGWFRSSGGTPNGFPKYFSPERDDPVGAREIINGDTQMKPSWGGGATMGELIAGYHSRFYEALELSLPTDGTA